ncbi:MAG: cohesin domain-containing protein, partial [bacterium]|nr:cohesin domain-containing protein [bacterium]
MKNKTLISLKKIINYALVAVVVASNLSFVPVAKAVGEPTVTIGSQSALNGATINVPVDASNFANAVAGMDFSVQYDSALLTYTGLTQNAISGHGTLLTNNNANPIPINWFDSVALNIDSGAILTLNFTVISAATTNVNLTFAGTKELSGVSDIINPTSFVPGVISLNPAPTLSSIAITTPATKLSYTVGDVLDLTGLVVTGTYSDASTQVETVTTSNVSGFDSSAPATGQVLTITVGGQIATYTVDIVTPVNSAKAITAFSFATPAATGVINEGTHTITVTVPFGTAVVALTPTIVITGTSISSLSGVAQDFTSPVVYTVTADDASTQNYTVTVIITAPSDLTALNAAIVSAQSLHDGANEGTTPGEYAVGSKAILQSAINTAALITSSEAQSVVDAAVVNLNAAITTFNAGLVALSDLSSLITAIASAQTLHDGATEGTSPGEYTVGSKAILQSAIDAASLITSSETQSVV